MASFSNQDYWSNRYQENKTGWDIGSVSSPIKEYADQLKDKSLRVLIPGVGYGYEAEYFFSLGFVNTHVLDIAHQPLQQFLERCPSFPEENVFREDFFNHTRKYDLIIEQTFFCSMPPEWRPDYVTKMYELLKPGGKLVGLLFKHPLDAQGNRPFGGDEEEYKGLFKKMFKLLKMEDCRNSIPPRAGNELFFILEKPSYNETL